MKNRGRFSTVTYEKTEMSKLTGTYVYSATFSFECIKKCIAQCGAIWPLGFICVYTDISVSNFASGVDEVLHFTFLHGERRDLLRLRYCHVVCVASHRDSFTCHLTDKSKSLLYNKYVGAQVTGKCRQQLTLIYYPVTVLSFTSKLHICLEGLRQFSGWLYIIPHLTKI
jgi:hypothetical protein